VPVGRTRLGYPSDFPKPPVSLIYLLLESFSLAFLREEMFFGTIRSPEFALFLSVSVGLSSLNLSVLPAFLVLSPPWLSVSASLNAYLLVMPW